MYDIHTHCHQPEHRGSVNDDYSRRAYGERDWSFSPAEFSTAMREGGVVRAAVFGVTALASDLMTPNEWVEEFCAQVDIDTVPFMSLDLNDPGYWDVFHDGIRRGFKGVKLYPTAALFDPSSEEFDPFYRAATEHGIVLLWHQGATPNPLARLSLSMPFLIDEVARRHPRLTQVLAHMAHPWQREAIIVIRKNERVFADVSANWERPQDGYGALVRAQEWGVVDKLLFGSDYPHWTPREGAEGLRSLAARKPTDMPHIHPSTIEHLLESDHFLTLGLS
jgi:predicted TIM-barrel fold metal-dependent hydrolase